MSNQIVVEGLVDGAGLLSLLLPLGAAEAGKHARITVELMECKKPLSTDEWRKAILATAGGWQGDFELPKREFPEVRAPLS